MRVTGQEKECPKCGKEFDKGVKFRCPYCATLISRRARKCPSCQVDLASDSEDGSRSADRMLSELRNDLIQLEYAGVAEEDKKFSCPNCTRLLDGTESKCPKCGQVFADRLGLRCPICGTPVDKGFKECPKCGISLEKVLVDSNPVVLFDSRSMYEPEGRVIEPEPVHPTALPCPLCGAIIPQGMSKCPLCNTQLLEKPTVDVPAMDQASPEVAKSVPPEALMISPRPVRQRKLKAKVTTIPERAQTAAHGRTNGIGQVNGLGRVNGTGTSTGGAFVNGTGISNGLGGRPASAKARRPSLVTRWQLLAVLLAIIIVIPTFFFLSYANKEGGLSIDGSFADWEGATTYGMNVHSTATTSNVTEWAVAVQGSDLFFFIKTQAHMMSSQDPESYYLFVDSDGSYSTGYTVGSIGADYMLELTGWDYSVNSSSLREYTVSVDHFNWTAWSPIGSLSYSLDHSDLEASARMPTTLSETARFMLVSKDSRERGSVSYTAPLKGGALVVRQTPAVEIASGIVPKSPNSAILELNFTCEGEGGQVSRVSTSVVGASVSSPEPAFSLEKGQSFKAIVTVDTSAAADGELVSAVLLSSGIVSTFSSVEIIGQGAKAYAGAPPPSISIDGAFADWTGLLSADVDSSPVTTPRLNINEIGNLSTPTDSYFYVSVEGEICTGTFVPAYIARPSGAGGGGVVVPSRHTAEDTLNIYVDSDRSNSTGRVVTLDSKRIGADQKIEVKGLFGKITSTKEFTYSSSSDAWIESTSTIRAAKDEKCIEIGVNAASLGGSQDLDFIVETTSWKGQGDFATPDPSSTSVSALAWTVDSFITSPYATSMSYQRKMFYDGVNYWSVFFDGTTTVYKYSTDDGQTWTSCGPVFRTAGVNETSIWYEPSTSMVYAVGDTSSASTDVSIQVGTVNAPAHTISWAASDSKLTSSTNPLAGKNTYICKDLNGYLWVLASNYTLLPASYQLSAFRSSVPNSTASWQFTGQMLNAAVALDNVKGSIVPAGSGSDVWAVYTYSGNVAARKNTGTWQAQQIIFTQAGIKANTDNSPPSVVVDGKGVVHVVYGNGRRSGAVSLPTIEYSHNNTGSTTFTPGLSLDPLIPAGVGDYYPTITLETSTGGLYALWLRGNTSSVPTTVMGRVNISGTWSDMVLGPQTRLTKLYLTSIYEIDSPLKVCWQWTQNTTAPIETVFDGTMMIPEFGNLVLPIVGFMLVLAVYRQRPWKGRE